MTKVDKVGIEERIRVIAQNTDSLIARLDTLTNRIDTAKVNENQELVEYYEKEFAEAAVEFMDGIETIIDDWYRLRGEQRPTDTAEPLQPEMLDELHSTVVGIVQGLSVAYPEQAGRVTEKLGEFDARSGSGLEPEPSVQVAAPPGKKTRGGKVDFTG